MLYVIKVKAGEEHRTLSELDSFIRLEGEEFFVPVYDRKKKYKGEEKLVTSVLFPGYLFCKTDDVTDLFLRLRKIIKLTKFLRAGADFLSVSAEEEDNLIILGGEDHHVKVSMGIIEGSNVRIISGPMEDFKGPLLHIDRHKKLARVGMEIGGQLKEVEVGLEIISKL